MSKKKDLKKKKNKLEIKSSAFSFIRFMKRHLTLIISILIPSTIYLIGFSYENGFLGEFGIPNDIFPNNIEHYFLQGFYVLSSALFSFIFKIKILGVFIFFIILLYAIVSIEKIDSLRKLLEKRRRKKIKSKKGFTSKDYFENLFVFSVFSLLFPFLFVAYFTIYFILFNELSNKYGAIVAKDLKENFEVFHGCESYENHPYDCAIINHKIRGTIISMQYNNIILWDGENAKLHVLGENHLTFMNSIDGEKDIGKIKK